jgi:plastocyanin
VTRTALRAGTAAAVAVPLALVALAASGGAHQARAARASRPVVTIRLGEYFFRPAVVTVHVGQRVRFLNVGKIPHTVADRRKGASVPLGKLIKPHELDRGASQTVVFHAPGTVYYFCTFHPTLMAGRVQVVR